MVGDDRIVIFGKISGGVRPICFASPHLYYLSSYKNCLVFDFLVWFASSVSFSFDFHRSLFDREAIEVASLLALLDEFNFRLGRRDVCIWSPNPLECFSCKSFFSLVVIGSLSC